MESMTSSAATAPRRPCFAEEDDGLASLADMEAGVSGNHGHHCHAFYSRPLCYSRRSSLRNFQTVSFSSSSLSTSMSFSPRSGLRFYDARFEEHQPHFLEACFLCKKPLSENKDIYMYRGDTPFCSEDCRSEQIEIDEAKEKNFSMKALRKNQDQRKSSSPNKNKDYPFRTGAVAAA